jgi:hypothetical protein
MRSFRPALLLPLFIFVCIALYSQNQPTPTIPNALTNQDVVGMLKAGLTQELVIAKIKVSSCHFDTSPVTLEQLKAADVPDNVILAMIQAQTSPNAIVQQDHMNDKVPPSHQVEKPCKEPSWPSGQIWDAGSLTYSGVDYGNKGAVQLLANASKYYLLSNLPEEGDPPIGWWSKVTCPEDADIWIFAKKHLHYFGPLQPNMEVYHILITSPQPSGSMVYNHMFVPEGNLWTHLVQRAGELRDSALKETQKQLNKQRKEQDKKKPQQ